MGDTGGSQLWHHALVHLLLLFFLVQPLLELKQHLKDLKTEEGNSKPCLYHLKVTWLKLTVFVQGAFTSAAHEFIRPAPCRAPALIQQGLWVWIRVFTWR